MPRKMNPPSVRCTATNRRGEHCKRYATPGRTSCVMHSALGGPAGRPAMEERAMSEATLATLLAASPGRPIWTVVLDAIHNVDALVREVKGRVIDGENDTDTLDRLAELSKLAHTLAASAITTKAIDAAGQAADAWGEVISGRVAALVQDHLGLPMAREGRTAQALSATLGGVDLSAGADAPPSPDGPPVLDLVGRAVASAMAPRLGVPVESLACWFTQLVAAVDGGRPVPDPPVPAVAALPPAPERPADPLAALDEPEPENRAEDRTHDCEPAHLDPEAASPEPLTVDGQDAEPEVVEGELVEPDRGEAPRSDPEARPDPDPEPRRIWDPATRTMRKNPNYTSPRREGGRVTTTLGSGPAQPLMPSSSISPLDR